MKHFMSLVIIISLTCILSSTSVAEWITNESFPPIGDSNAKKGGSLSYATISYPATFRFYGPNTNTWLTNLMNELVYQTLISVHPNTLEFIPSLADAWEIKEDNKTFLFRLNPNARWADGQPVTPEDVVFSFQLVVDPNTQDPYSADLFGRLFETPEIVDERTVKFTAKTLHWRNFIFCGANLLIVPAHTYRGKKYVEELNWDLPNGSGPYKLDSFKKGNNIIFTRRDDFWGKNRRENLGVYNFDQIKFVVVRDETLIFEKFKKGEFDSYHVRIAKQWAEETDIDKIRQGWIQKRKVFTFEPNGVSGLALNMRRPPFDDVRVRKALAYLFNREMFMEKLFFNEYQNTYSYFPNSLYENSNNEKIEYNPQKAQELLAEAGWKERNAEGILTKDGMPFSTIVLYGEKTVERYLTIFQEDLRKAGIDLKLKQLDYAAMYKLVDDWNFDLASLAWGGMTFPNPEANYHSKYADIHETNNVTGLKIPRVDEILDQYPLMFDLKERVAALQELDGLVYNEHPYILGWFAPFTRILYWDKFGMPESYLSKFGNYNDIVSLWWYDADKDAQLTQAIKAKTALPVGETDIHYWENK